MKNHSVISLDLAKEVIQVAVFKNDRLVSNQAMSRTALKKMLSVSVPSQVVMESCGSASYWGRFAKQCGHDVKSYNARFVKAFRVGQKTDANDALAINEASRARNVKPCRLLSEEHQVLQSIERMRQLLEKQKRQVGNQLRGLLGEFGLTIAQSEAALCRKVPDYLEDADSGLPLSLRESVSQMFKLYRHLQNELNLMTEQLTQHVKHHEPCQRLMKLEGVGPVVACGLVTFLSSGEHLKNARDASASVGVTPQQHSSGGKVKLGSIPKVVANKTLRSQLFLGARAVVIALKKRDAKTDKERWVKALTERKGIKCAAIALANKTVRTAYAMLKNGTEYQVVKHTL